MKQKLEFYCSNCDYRPPKWLGCCPECKEWNSIIEKELNKAPVQLLQKASCLSLTLLDELSFQAKDRMLSGIAEWDRVVGGGIMQGSFIIVTGDPGIGKSTLLLQIAHQLSQNNRVFYFSSEESLEQVNLRAKRLNFTYNKLLFSDQGNLESIITTAQEKKPDLIIVDSIQNCYSTTAHTIPGTVSQLRESAFHLMRLAKEHNVAVIVTGHITKEGTIAGPKMLEHMVDAVFYLQGEDRWQTRVLRSVKNRFGAINEIGFFEMRENGLQEVANINQQLLNEASYACGSALISYSEGSRPFLIELQALTVPSKFGIPQRVISGIDQKQVVIIAAILEKYLQIPLSSHDIFFKMSGGFRIKESSADLGIALALLSSYCKKPLPQKSLALGEINLTGQVKPINQISMHVNEAQKFGIEQLLIAKNQKLEKNSSSSVQRFHHVYELLGLFEE
jgi:DNA repair protein RadA/Sms